MLKHVWFRGLKLLREVDLPLGRLNVIVGRNGVGKSTVLEGLEILARSVRQDKGGWLRFNPGRDAFGSLTDVTPLLSRPGPVALELQLALDPGADRLQVLVADRGMVDLNVTLGVATLKLSKRGGIGDTWGDHANRGPTQLGLTIAARLNLHAPLLAAAHYAEEAQPQLQPDGTGLASVLGYIQGLRDGTLEAIETDLGEVVKGVRRIRALPARLVQRETMRITVNGQDSLIESPREVTGTRFEVEFDGIGWIPAEQLSEGTLLALGLLTALHHTPANLLLLDDLDQGLHPMAQRDMVRLIKRVQEKRPDLQVVATSHSPFVLDELDATEVFVAGAVAPTSTQIRRLDRHPAWQKRSGYMHPGEFWSAVGEGWVAD